MMDFEEAFLVDDYDKYHRMVTFGPELADELKTFLYAKQYDGAYALINNEDILVVEHILELLCEETPAREFVDLLGPLTQVCLNRMVELDQRDDRAQLGDSIICFVRHYMTQTKGLTVRAIDHEEKSIQGTKCLEGKVREKHEELLRKASLLRKLNPRLSKKRMGDLLIQRGETDYSPSTISEILKGLDTYIEWESGPFSRHIPISLAK